uniref:Putative copia protein n=1 Tax=Helianthus annuus TaxID=4232 RepID=A0A251TCA0_HELAN
MTTNVASNGGIQTQTPKLLGQNYYHWHIQMKVLLESQDLWTIVEEGYTEIATGAPENEQNIYKEKIKRDKKALHIIFQAVNETVFERIATCRTSKDAWEVLHKAYRGENRVKTVRLQTLRCEFDSLRMKETETVEDYVNRITIIVNQLRMNDERLEEQRVVEKILRSLTRKYESVVVAIEESKDLNTISTEELLGILQSHELRLRQYDDNTSVEQAFQVHSNGYDKSRFSRFDNSERGRGKGKGKFNRMIRCYNCQRLGHTARFCNKREEGERSNNVLMHKDDTEDETEDTMFMIFNTEEVVKNDCWYLDSGCSNHMTGNKDLFINLNDSERREVRTGDDKRLEVLGCGDVNVKIKGYEKRIPNVFYVAGLKHNLLSVGQLVQKGYDVCFNDKGCVIHDSSGRCIGVVKMTGNKMYPLNLNHDVVPRVCNMTTQDNSTLWHRRYGHLNLETLHDMGKNGIVNGLPKINKSEHVCEGCVFGKHARKPFSKKAKWRASEPLQLVHSDICGPMNTPSIGGCKYFITFIDDFSRKTWVYFLKLKSDALRYFKNFKQQVENQIECKIKGIRTDRGGEYCGHEFQNFLKNNGIHHQLTTSYTPQQNGVAERKNRTLMELSRSMLKMKELPNTYWAEAVACATYLLNRATTKSVPKLTPQEAWSGKKPNVDHLRVFGCIAYVHIPKQNRSKLDDKTERAIFVGYSEHSKGYKLFNPITHKMIISRDVIFSENQHWATNKENDSGLRIEISNTSGDDDDAAVAVDDQIDLPTPNDEDNVQHTNIEVEIPGSYNESPTDVEETGNNENNGSSSDSENEVIRTKPITQVYHDTTELTEAQVRELYRKDQGNTSGVVNFVLYADTDPTTYVEASKETIWQDAMDREMESIIKNDTWELVDPPLNQTPIGVKWIYKTKYDEHGQISKHKARLVVKGYNQKYGIDYQDVFAPVIRFDTVRLVLALAAHHGWHLHQMDVKTAFLNGYLKEQVFIEQPEGYVVKGKERKVCKLKKALYGLKQAPRAWYSRIEGYFATHGFKRCIYEHTLFTKMSKEEKIIICLYVDDLIIASDSLSSIESFKELMKKEFEMTDMGILHYFLGMEVSFDNGNIILTQQQYAKSLLSKFNMMNCSGISTPMEYGLRLTKQDPDDEVEPNLYRRLVGSLMYLTNTRPDIMFAVNKISQFMEQPKRSHWEAGKRILRYIKGTLDQGLVYSKGGKGELIGYSDSDYAGNIDDSKSTSGYVFQLGTGTIAWQSKKQKVVALSSTEAEYIALSLAGCQALWLKGILNELHEEVNGPVIIHCDNKSTICLAKDPMFHGKSKHIRIKYHFIRDLIKNNDIEVRFCPTGNQVADILTKALQLKVFSRLKELLQFKDEHT